MWLRGKRCQMDFCCEHASILRLTTQVPELAQMTRRDVTLFTVGILLCLLYFIYGVVSGIAADFKGALQVRSDLARSSGKS